MKKYLVALIITCLFFNHLVAQNSFNKAKTDSLFNELAQNERFMGSACLLQNDQVLYKRAIGKRQIVPPLANDEQTTFRVGAISKMFTSVLVFQLIEKRKLSLDTKLAQFYPQVPNAKNITIADLLLHRSGLYNVVQDSSFATWRLEAQSKDKIIEVLRQFPSQFTPSSKAEYNSSNYILLGYIVEDIYKKPLDKVLQKQIAKKAKLKNTYIGSSIDAQKNEAYSYYYYKYEWKKSKHTHLSIPQGAGAVVSTPYDLTLFIKALFEQKLIGKNYLDMMLSLQDGFGHGIFQFKVNNQVAWGHNGGIDNFGGTVLYFPETKIAFALCSNANNYPVTQVVAGMLNITFGEPYQIPNLEIFKLTEEELKQYEGEYLLTEASIKMTLKINEGILTAYSTKENGFPLTPIGNDSFEFKSGNITIDILRDGSKNISGLLMNQNGRPYQFEKM